ncbi:Spo0E like sporulation regulatory protein (modular protein) [Candidatus Desulfosporosinus infrequens]|uniref:Spo0E like sporulation regulatory protein (Modular protein) n=1 Tax=Candidatus Desulfosporosinus infrequens TaxID=2043169 RepID=A0A2U3KLN6_9FIRM|nr:Spo0E like sporulation regulatory protein (modular protein) [Candidatus Desulfosporosinus infrequens]
MVQEQIEVKRISKQGIAFDIELKDPRVVSISGKLEELIKQIEELRSIMIKLKEGRSYTDHEVITASQELDVVLDKYQEMMMKNNANQDLELK